MKFLRVEIVTNIYINNGYGDSWFDKADWDCRYRSGGIAVKDISTFQTFHAKCGPIVRITLNREKQSVNQRGTYSELRILYVKGTVDDIWKQLGQFEEESEEFNLEGRL